MGTPREQRKGRGRCGWRERRGEPTYCRNRQRRGRPTFHRRRRLRGRAGAFRRRGRRGGPNSRDGRRWFDGPSRCCGRGQCVGWGRSGGCRRLDGLLFITNRGWSNWLRAAASSRAVLPLPESSGCLVVVHRLCGGCCGDGVSCSRATHFGCCRGVGRRRCGRHGPVGGRGWDIEQRRGDRPAALAAACDGHGADAGRNGEAPPPSVAPHRQRVPVPKPPETAC